MEKGHLSPQQMEISPYNSVSRASSGSSVVTSESEYESNPILRFINSFRPFDYSQIDFLFNDEEQNLASHEAAPRHHGSNDSIREHSAQQSHKRQYHPQFDYSRLTKLERAAIITSTSPLSRTLKSRHLQMIALGGSIGM